MKTITLTLTEPQARTVAQACDLYARIHIGQWERIVDDAWIGFGRDFNAMHALQDALRDLARICIPGVTRTGNPGIHNPDVPDRARVAFDVNDALERAMHECDGKDGKPCYSVKCNRHDPHWTSTEDEVRLRVEVG